MDRLIYTAFSGLNASMVATRLPRDLTTWADLGFVQASPVTGVPDVDIPVRHPLVQRIIEAYRGREKGPGNGGTN